MGGLIAILGPTASGKTALAVAAARQLGGEVVNCDAMQMYAELPRLTAQPTGEERRGVPHHLFGVLRGAERGNVARFVELARPVLAAIRARGNVPVLCGGTGMYFKALTEGLAQIPPIPIVLHEMAVALQKDIGGAALRARLMAVDAETATRLHDGDTQRLVRAWEVYVATGTPLSVWQRETHDAVNVERDWQALVLRPPRAALYAKIDARFTAMLADGVVDEVRALLAQNLPADLPVMRAHGVPELAAHLRGECALDEAAARARQVTRNYAKRQMTWFTHQLAAKYPQRVKVAEGFGSEDFGSFAAAAGMIDWAQTGG